MTTWVRFGRNEPLAPSLPLRSNRGESLDLHRFHRDGTLMLFFTPPGGLEGCRALLSALSSGPLREQEADLLVVSDRERDLAEREVAVAFDRDSELRNRYAGLIAVDSAGQALVCLLDRDGSPVYAWIGGCDEAEDVASQLMQKLQSAAFLCPECSVPDPASSALWDVTY